MQRGTLYHPDIWVSLKELQDRKGVPCEMFTFSEASKCTVAREMLLVTPYCEPDYGMKTYDDQNYGEGWVIGGNTSHTAWQYRDTFALDGLPMVSVY